MREILLVFGLIGVLSCGELLETSESKKLSYSFKAEICIGTNGNNCSNICQISGMLDVISTGCEESVVHTFVLADVKNG